MLQIFLQKIYKKENNQKGFTLIELMVVIAIIAGAIALVLPRISNPNNQIRSTLRELITLTRELHTRAKLQGKTYRLVFALKSDDPKEANMAQAFYIESSNGQVLLYNSDDEKTLREQQARNAKDEKSAKADLNGFQPDNSILKKPKILPQGLEVTGIEVKRSKEMLTTGKVGIHFFPQGIAEEAIIHFKSKDQVWSLVIDPMIGKASLIGQEIHLKDLGGQ